MSPHLVAATSRPTYTHRVICRPNVLLQLVAKCVRTLKRPWMLLKRGTGSGERGAGSGERGTEVWERVVSGNLQKNPIWPMIDDREPSKET